MKGKAEQGIEVQKDVKVEMRRQGTIDMAEKRVEKAETK